jgi:hypothetical protein
MKNLKTLVAAFVFSMGTLSAQTTVPNVLNLRSVSNSGTIVENNKIVGYYVFYTKEKVDKENNAYEIAIFDDNYNASGNFEIVRSKKSVLLEVVYNGSSFMMQFYNNKTGMEFVSYDRSGTLLGKSTIAADDLSKWEVRKIEANYASQTENLSIYPMGNQGFIRNTFVKNDKLGYEIVAYDNNAKEIWSYGTDPNSSLVETSEIVDVSENILTATVAKKKNMMTKEMDMYCLILDTKTGKKIKEFQLGTEATGRKSILKSFINEKTQKIIIVGEYFKPKDDYLKDKSQGIFAMELDLSGNELSTTEYAWKGDIDKFKMENMDEEDKKEAGKPFSIFFHDIVVSDNGHIFLIGEQFRKQVSAGGVAMQLAAGATGGSTNAGAFEVRVGNMVVIELDENKKMVDFDIVSKKKTSINVPGGGLMSSSTMGYYIKSLGGFDYSFTSRDEAKDQFDIVYIDFNRKEQKGDIKKSDVMIGVISVRDGEDSAKRVPINSNSFYFWIQPAKPGYISVGEYYRKEKKLEFRMESLSN